MVFEVGYVFLDFWVGSVIRIWFVGWEECWEFFDCCVDGGECGFYDSGIIGFVVFGNIGELVGGVINFFYVGFVFVVEFVGGKDGCCGG